LDDWVSASVVLRWQLETQQDSVFVPFSFEILDPEISDYTALKSLSRRAQVITTLV